MSDMRESERRCKILISASDADEMISHAKACFPQEACGLLSGNIEEDIKRVARIYRMTNIDASGSHFSIEPKEQLAAIKDMRARGIVPLGNFHSHPETPARPSEEDIRLAYDPAASYVIISLAGETPVMRAFHIEDGAALDEEIEIFESYL
ncbi:MAG: M67 family metallopeptidase [Synergistaceae bacterium]|jgi:proteasome lid subunit RPN8/RPN11|nr:M67 family metallopeptidase [Synergistaceae bacterium]